MWYPLIDTAISTVSTFECKYIADEQYHLGAPLSDVLKVPRF